MAFKAVLGKSEISFTFTLTDNIYLTKYDLEWGYSLGTLLCRTSDIGQEQLDGTIFLVDDQAYLAPPTVSPSQDKDPRVKWDGYGWIIDGFNIKCCGKCDYEMSFYSPAGYLYAEDDGDLKKN